VLFGHSLGGYFTSYVLLQQLRGKHNVFRGFITASPSFNYNRYYLLDQFQRVATQSATKQKVNTYFTYGGLEDEEEADDTTLLKNDIVLQELAKHIGQKQEQVLIYKSDLYTGLGHMDTPIPTFVKGLQWMFDE
jgi:predicted alpha/beta superfamily hydrolase